MDSTLGRKQVATNPISRRDVLFALGAGLLPSGTLLAHSGVAPAKISIVFDFSDDRVTQVAGGIHNFFSSTPETQNVRLRDVDLAMLDMAMSADVQKRENLVIGIGDTTAEAFAKRKHLFPTGHCWLGAIRETQVDVDDRQIHQHLLRRDYDLYLERVCSLLPDCKRIGILHDQHVMPSIRSIVQAIEDAGLEHLCIEVSKPSDIDSSITRVAAEADVLFGIECSHIYNDMTARRILGQSFAQNLPMIGLSSEWVRAGALLSMDWNLEVLGSQIAAWAYSGWHKPDRQRLIVDTPPDGAYDFFINTKSAKHFATTLGVSIPDSGVMIYE